MLLNILLEFLVFLQSLTPFDQSGCIALTIIIRTLQALKQLVVATLQIDKRILEKFLLYFALSKGSMIRFCLTEA